jgi:hypothetical protein
LSDRCVAVAGLLFDGKMPRRRKAKRQDNVPLHIR